MDGDIVFYIHGSTIEYGETWNGECLHSPIYCHRQSSRWANNRQLQNIIQTPGWK